MLKISTRVLALLAGLMCSISGFAQITTINFSANQPAALSAFAGPSPIICPGDTVMIGGNPSAIGGTAPFSYAWTPSSGLTSASASEPMASPTITTTYALEVTDARNCTDTSSVTVTVDTCIAITEVPSVGKVSIFPNPNGGRFKVLAELNNQPTTCMIHIFSLNGQEVYRKVFMQPGSVIDHEINLSDLSAGVYHAELIADGITFSSKVIIR